MAHDPNEILTVLDRCCDTCRFPMLDNGYVYLAATRLSLLRSATDWALVIEVFGFAPRAGMPDTSVQVFASRFHSRRSRKDYVNAMAYEQYLANNPNNEFYSVWPIEEGAWLKDWSEQVADSAVEVVVRGETVPLPNREEYARHGIDLVEPPRVRVFEMCRYLADVSRERVLATSEERRASLFPDMQHILQLEEWNHPNVAMVEERPSKSETFQQLAMVLATGDVGHYRPSLVPNTHWRNWPDGETL